MLFTSASLVRGPAFDHEKNLGRHKYVRRSSLAESSDNLSTQPSHHLALALYLQAEQESATEPQHKALLLHELGVVEERSGEEMEAAREFLAAFNSHAQFREPLEGLVRLLERRKSVKNLPKLLDALLRVADSPVERARALVKRAAFLTDYEKDDPAAKDSLLQATARPPLRSDPLARARSAGRAYRRSGPAGAGARSPIQAREESGVARASVDHARRSPRQARRSR